jgi:exodeoxyribonuclease V gamma subunit
MAKVRDQARRIIGLCERMGMVGSTRRGCDVDVTLPDGRNLTGTVADTVGSRLLSIGYSKVSPKRRLVTWAQWLALVAAEPDRGWQAATVGREVWRGRKAQATTLEPDRLPSGDAAKVAEDLLQRLVDLYDRGMRAPIPLYCAASAKSAAERHNDRPPTHYVFKEWESNDYEGYAREDADPYHLLVLGRRVPTDELFEERCADADEASWVAGDDRRFVAYAWRLWEPILDTERVRTG